MENNESVNEEVKAENIEIVDEAAEEVKAKEVEAEGKEEATREDPYKEKYFYLAAEMQNMQKRFDREKEGLIKFGNEKLLKDLVEVIDNLERTLTHIKDDEDEKIKNLSVGIKMIEDQFLNTLKKFGLTKVNALGEIFDPNFHEALAQMPAEGKEEMEVIQVHQEGYVLNERLVRPAKVVVCKNEE